MPSPEPPSLATAKEIVARLKEAGHEAYLVGGCVRDLLRGVEPGDYDIATSAPPEEVRRLFRHTVPVGISFGVVLVMEKGHSYEVATFRADLPYLDGRRPSGITHATARQDVLRRDFTVNGLLLDPVTEELQDYVGGRQDLEGRLIRAIGEPEERFAEDHLRMLRAVRLTANLDFTLDRDTLAAIRAQAAKIALVSAERIREELTRILTEGRARRGMELLEAAGLLKHVLPEIHALKGVVQSPEYHPEGDVWEHTMRMLALLPPVPRGCRGNGPLAWGALLHDAGKATARREEEGKIHFHGHVRQGVDIARNLMYRLRFSSKMMETVLALIHYHMHFREVLNMRSATLKKFLRIDNFTDHLELHRLDCLASHGNLANYRFCQEKLLEYDGETLLPAKLLTGRDLQEMGFKPGPRFKVILDALEEAQLEGQVDNREDALLFVRSQFSGETIP